MEKLSFNTTHNMDCLDGLVRLEPHTFDAIVTSPPYFAPPYYKQEGLGATAPEYLVNVTKRLDAAMRTLKLSGVMFLNHADVQPLRMPWQIVGKLVDLGHRYFGEFIWMKSEVEHESVYVLGKMPETRAALGRISGVWNLSRDVRDLHFPEALVERCLRRLLRIGRVLDPFMGFGTTGAVAKRLGWEFMGFEKMPETCASANKRTGVPSL